MRKMTLAMTLGIATAFAGSATMLAEGCSVPRYSGMTILFLNVKGLSCAEGSAKVIETLKLGYGKQPSGYKCAQSVAGRNTTFNCDATDKSGKHYDFRASAQ